MPAKGNENTARLVALGFMVSVLSFGGFRAVAWLSDVSAGPAESVQATAEVDVEEAVRLVKAEAAARAVPIVIERGAAKTATSAAVAAARPDPVYDDPFDALPSGVDAEVLTDDPAKPAETLRTRPVLAEPKKGGFVAVIDAEVVSPLEQIALDDDVLDADLVVDDSVDRGALDWEDPEVELADEAGVIFDDADGDELADDGHWIDDTEIHTVPYWREVHHRIEPGETISAVFDRYRVAAGEAHHWIKAAREVYNLNSVFVGQRLTILIDAASNTVLSLQMEIDPATNLVARRQDEGVIAAREPVDLDRKLRVVKGRVATSFYTAAAESEVPDKIIADVAEILGWDINFATDLRPGAEFRVVYEELERAEGARKIPGRVLAVEIESRRKRYEGVYFKDPNDGSTGYYDRTGQSLGRDFLRYPVAFTRISSHFSAGRFHPVLKRRKPHHGVDFAAPPGTPVRSVADGVVMIAGWKGGNGRFVKVRHDSVYDSGYAHLSRIASGMRQGVRVKKGQVIGYVGSTGLATGPHLHFAMYKSGDYINPLSANMPRSRSLAGPDLERFADTLSVVDHAYAKAEDTGSAVLLASVLD